MSTGFCSHCGLKLDGTADVGLTVHAYCLPAWSTEQAAQQRRPKSAMEQQLDRIEGLLMVIRDNQPQPFKFSFPQLEKSPQEPPLPDPQL